MKRKTLRALIRRDFIFALTDIRVWAALLFGLAAGFMPLQECVNYAKANGQAMNVMESYLCFYGHKMGGALEIVFFTVLFCTTPAGHEDAQFILYRTGRLPWLLGKVMYIFLFSLFVQGLFALVGAAYVAPYAYIGSQYSRVLYGRTVVQAFFWQLLLNVLSGTLLGMIQLAVNLRFKRIYGALMSGLIIALGAVRGLFGLPCYLSPMDMTALSGYSYTGTYPECGAAILPGLCLLLTAGSLFECERKAFVFGE